MNKYLPSKKIIVATIILVALVIVMLVVSNYSAKPAVYTENIVTKNTVIDIVDTDNDGLKDWEEALWGTDINNPDTDGDGTMDGDEISKGRNPTIAGPDDVLEEKFIFDKISSNAPLSDTDKLTREFIRQYTLLQQSGDVSSEELSELAKIFASGAFNETKGNKYTYTSVKTIPTTYESLHRYANTIAELLSAKNYPADETELDIFKKVFEENRVSEAQKLQSIIPIYEKLEQDFLLLNAPKILSTYHIDLINAFANIAYALEEIRVFESDPVKGIRGTVIYQENVKKVLSSMYKISDILVSQKVEFSKDDPGYEFLPI